MYLFHGDPMKGKGGLSRAANSLPMSVVVLLVAAASITGGCVGSPQSPIERPIARREGVYHIVKRHQTLWRICKTYDVDMADVARINGIADVSQIRAGQRVFIPGAEKALDVGIYIEDIGPPRKKARRLDLAKVKGRFVWPVKGPILKGFNPKSKEKHDGIDIGAPSGTAINSIESGEVLYSGNEIIGYGNIVIIKHGPTFSSVYAHNAVNLVREGDRVDKGQLIARVGNTGRAEDFHLHFEIRNHNRPMNPLLILP
jgi:murein DD-endopeptidase MepM/ murein hydrolase activator NlpD